MTIPHAPLLALLAAAVGTASVAAQTPAFDLEVEGGPVWQTYNDVEIPNDGSATRFSLSDLVGSGPEWTGRVYLSWRLTERSSIRLLYAPFTLAGRGTPSRPLSFAGEGYAAGEPLQSTYTFNSYRASYRWQWHSGDRTALWVGFTAKIRDATVALRQGTTASRKDDVGFVPLLHVAGLWRLAPGIRLSLDADGLAGGPGRAVDAALKVAYDLGERWSVSGGYRTVEGGADVEEVYSFAWLNYGIVAVRLRL